ncbi:MAG: hypothetical protein A2W33_05435 [Chloroflexi bacterium RBG_16_52_11]|nr:MAG: hypothetical protein A2W33_05435 [Chloroflexi bacterium RBG_16_52_11]
MDAETTAKLIALNRQFYQTFSIQFSATRIRLQPGVIKILDAFPERAAILDIGCGNGNLAAELVRRGWRGSYLGLDSSPQLLEFARMACAGADNIDFLLSELSEPDWDQSVITHALSQHVPNFDFILAFAVLHHLPGETTRLNLLHTVRGLLGPKGQFIHSEWQFMNIPRLRARIQPLETAGLSPAGLDPEDYLLDWRHGGSGLRYVHHFSIEELDGLAALASFQVLETFLSDGEGGNLGLYQVWAPV